MNNDPINEKPPRGISVKPTLSSNKDSVDKKNTDAEQKKSTGVFELVIMWNTFFGLVGGFILIMISHLLHAIILVVDYIFIAIPPEIRINSDWVQRQLLTIHQWLWFTNSDQAIIHLRHNCNGAIIIVFCIIFSFIFGRKKADKYGDLLILPIGIYAIMIFVLFIHLMFR